MTVRRRVLVVTAVLVTLASATTAAAIYAPSASASEQRAPQTGELTKSAPVVAGTFRPNQAQPELICLYRMYWPFSNRQFGSVYATADVTCPIVVPNITVYASLERLDIPFEPYEVAGNSIDSDSTNYATTTAVAPCEPGVYRTKIVAGTFFPAGVQPPYETVLDFTDGLSIGC